MWLARRTTRSAKAWSVLNPRRHSRSSGLASLSNFDSDSLGLPSRSSILLWDSLYRVLGVVAFQLPRMGRSRAVGESAWTVYTISN